MLERIRTFDPQSRRRPIILVQSPVISNDRPLPGIISELTFGNFRNLMRFDAISCDHVRQIMRQKWVPSYHAADVFIG